MLLLALVVTGAVAGTARQVDICIYGGTSSGVMAAYTACKAGKTVLLVEPTDRIGGLTTGGLGMTDVGNPYIMKGYTRGFYESIGKYYGTADMHFTFEPKVALMLFQRYVDEAGIDILYNHRLHKVKKKGNRIAGIVVENSTKPRRKTDVRIEARVFLDCSYEGDLMAKAGVSYTTGREDNSQYGETWNGAHISKYHQFPDGVDPYVKRGDPKSGLVYGILPGSPKQTGEGNKDIQSYNFRITLTNDPANMIPITMPENYDPARYELLIRQIEKQPFLEKGLDDIFAWSLMPNHKTDINNRGGFSTDMIGGSWDYPDADYKRRAEIVKAHLDYTKGLLYFVGHDPRMPEHIRREIHQWGYPKDEFLTSDHFTPQLYVRESRRMLGRYVMTQANCESRTDVDDAVAWGAYNMDSHNCGRYVVNGMVKNEGDVQIGIPKPYKVSYRAITPKETECSNLIVPVCLSASHIAYGSIRMEPVFMVLGQSAALAACQAIDRHENVVQRVNAGEVYNQMDQ